MKISNAWYNDKECIDALRAGDIYMHDRHAFLVVSAIKRLDVYDKWAGVTGEGVCLNLFNITRSRMEYREQSIETEYHFFKLVARK